MGISIGDTKERLFRTRAKLATMLLDAFEREAPLGGYWREKEGHALAWCEGKFEGYERRSRFFIRPAIARPIEI
jgi:hypothetical protein